MDCKDVEQFEQAREYVDTGVIPLLSISAAKEMKMVVEQGIYRIVEYGARKRI